MADFLPPGYKTPERGGNYFKPKEAESRVRVLQPPILGFLAWTKPSTDKPHGQPVRRKLDDFQDVSNLDEKKGSKHFWAFAVWNYHANRVQVWEITQATIQSAIEALTYAKDWGDPRRYDLVIKRSGEGLNTQYQVLPAPPKRMTSEINGAWQDLKLGGFDIARLYGNGDPFANGAPADYAPEPEQVDALADETDPDEIPF